MSAISAGSGGGVLQLSAVPSSAQKEQVQDHRIDGGRGSMTLADSIGQTRKCSVTFRSGNQTCRQLTGPQQEHAQNVLKNLSASLQSQKFTVDRSKFLDGVVKISLNRTTNMVTIKNSKGVIIKSYVDKELDQDKTDTAGKNLTRVVSACNSMDKLFNSTLGAPAPAQVASNKIPTPFDPPPTPAPSTPAPASAAPVPVADPTASGHPPSDQNIGKVSSDQAVRSERLAEISVLNGEISAKIIETMRGKISALHGETPPPEFAVSNENEEENINKDIFKASSNLPESKAYSIKDVPYEPPLIMQEEPYAGGVSFFNLGPTLDQSKVTVTEYPPIPMVRVVSFPDASISGSAVQAVHEKPSTTILSQTPVQKPDTCSTEVLELATPEKFEATDSPPPSLTTAVNLTAVKHGNASAHPPMKVQAKTTSSEPIITPIIGRSVSFETTLDKFKKERENKVSKENFIRRVPREKATKVGLKPLSSDPAERMNQVNKALTSIQGWDNDRSGGGVAKEIENSHAEIQRLTTVGSVFKSALSKTEQSYNKAVSKLSEFRVEKEKAAKTHPELTEHLGIKEKQLENSVSDIESAIRRAISSQDQETLNKIANDDNNKTLNELLKRIGEKESNVKAEAGAAASNQARTSSIAPIKAADLNSSPEQILRKPERIEIGSSPELELPKIINTPIANDFTPKPPRRRPSIPD